MSEPSSDKDKVENRGPVDFHPSLIPNLRKLEIHAKRSALSQLFSGNWLSHIRGRGIEFSGYRQYISGDDASLIDWKASVRSRKLLVRELSEEKSLNILIAVDVSDSMLFGTTDKIKAEYAAEIACGLSFAAIRSGENVGLVLWSDIIRRYVQLGQGMEQHAALMKAISEPSNYGGKKDLAYVASRMLALSQPSLIVLISDFIGFDSSWESPLRVLAMRGDLLCICVRDPRDRTLPTSGEYILQDPSSGQKMVIDAADYAAPYREFVLAEEEKLHRLLRGVASDCLILETTDSYAKKLSQFFMIHGKVAGD